MMHANYRLAATVAATMATAMAGSSPVAAQSLDERAKVKALIWRKELANYAGRATSRGLQRYLDSVGPDYLVWPPGRPAPLHAADVRAQNAAAAKGDEEALVVTLTDFTMHDGTAIIFYSSHKTRTATGEVVDEWYDTIRVWSRYGRDWKLIGGLARRMR